MQRLMVCFVQRVKKKVKYVLYSLLLQVSPMLQHWSHEAVTLCHLTIRDPSDILMCWSCVAHEALKGLPTYCSVLGK